MNITKTKDKIKQYLEKYPIARDNDDALVATVHYFELLAQGHNPHDMTAAEFLKLQSKGHFTTNEAITRARRKMQEEHEHLRGEKYYERHQHQTEVKEQLGYTQQNLF
jgi:hypothetical protein